MEENKINHNQTDINNSSKIKTSLRYSIAFLLAAFILLSLPSLLTPTCFSTFSGGCKQSLTADLMSMFSYFLGFTFGIIGAIYLRKHNDLIDANKKKHDGNLKEILNKIKKF